MKKLLSIVIPVYNVEKYIEACLLSLQTIADPFLVEILLVDDGATDYSGAICDQMAARYDNVQVFHKKNGGLSDARNYGLRRCRGEYVFFLDSDDFVRVDMLSQILSVLQQEKVDVLLWDADMYDEEGRKLSVDSSYYHHDGVKADAMLTGRAVIEQQLAHHNDHVTTVWLGAYRREYLLTNHFWFEKGLLHEDEMWTQKVLIEARRVRYIPQAFYCYRVRENSIMRQKDKDYYKNVEALIYIHTSLYAYYDWKVKDAAFKKKLAGNTTKRYLHMIGKYKVSRYPELVKRIQRGQLWKHATTKKDKIRAGILCCSVRFYCLLAGFLKK